MQKQKKCVIPHLPLNDDWLLINMICPTGKRNEFAYFLSNFGRVFYKHCSNYFVTSSHWIIFYFFLNNIHNWFILFGCLKQISFAFLFFLLHFLFICLFLYRWFFADHPYTHLCTLSIEVVVDWGGARFNLQPRSESR